MLRVVEYKRGESANLGDRIRSYLSEVSNIPEVVVNYGCGSLWTPYDIILNTPSAVRVCAHKPSMMERLRGREEYRIAAVLDPNNILHLGMVVAKHIYHSGGKGMYLGPAAFIPRRIRDRLHSREYYMEEYLPSDVEWRVFVVGSDTLVREKTGGEGLIRNRRNGYVFLIPETPVREDVRKAAVSAVSALGLDFGAVDVGTKRESQELPVVYEVNSAPRITVPNTIEWLSKKLSRMILSKMQGVETYA